MGNTYESQNRKGNSRQTEEDMTVSDSKLTTSNYSQDYQMKKISTEHSGEKSHTHSLKLKNLKDFLSEYI